jgi:hypothetical protein
MTLGMSGKSGKKSKNQMEIEEQLDPETLILLCNIYAKLMLRCYKQKQTYVLVN